MLLSAVRVGISTHSAREDGDAYLFSVVLAKSNFNPLRPRGRRPIRAIRSVHFFQNFNPLRPRGRRRPPVQNLPHGQQISTHSAREDGDSFSSSGGICDRISTHSAREDGDALILASNASPFISTHSAREDGDKGFFLLQIPLSYFNPLRPRGRRHT